MARRYFSPEQEVQLLQAIKDAESSTSGEVVLHIENRCLKDVLERAWELFQELNVQDTKLKNGVLIYASFNDRKLAILADEGITAMVADNFWDQIRAQIISYFQDGEFTEGLVEGIGLVGDALATYFPRQEDTTNELPDTISFGE